MKGFMKPKLPTKERNIFEQFYVYDKFMTNQTQRV